ncbi:hypothetical protein LX32DRAFT_632389 [Colletotrichum zoysiae]|uniref:ATP adenylyltransferase n=1 Tax=Colletotrichum zoysiae TaxID=1216348 RepID=A0AAD9LT62_9PEZI|nr:hypothetical protein LX32DRAFT_632389 [Colletotrichum zoysiae]
MASTAIDEASVLARFDELVADGVVMYAKDMERVYLEDRGFKFEFRITSALKSKPAAVSDNAELDDANGGADGGGSQHTPSKTKEPVNGTATGTVTGNGSAGRSSNGTPRVVELDADGCVPGGDISIAGYEIGLVGGGGAHVLAFNKFCAYRPHLMLVTADGRRRQFEALDGADLGAAREVLAGLRRRGGQEYLVIFNCGKKGGCSRLHKHMQVIPAPDAIPLWPDEAGASGGRQEPPFRYFLHRFAGPLNGGGGGGGDEARELPSADELVGAYQRLLRQAAALVPGREGIAKDTGDRELAVVPHNVVLGGRWMVVIPRVADGVDGAGVNAAGMLGVVWAAEAETVDKWKRLGPGRVLGEVGIRG